MKICENWMKSAVYKRSMVSSQLATLGTSVIKLVLCMAANITGLQVILQFPKL